MATNDRAGPGTSTPCQKPMVANRHECSSALNWASRAGLGRSDWVSTGQRTRGRMASAAAVMARQLVNNASVRPSAASISAASSSCMAAS